MAAGGGDSGSKLDKSASDSKGTDESEDDAASDSDTTAGSTGSGGDDNSDDDGSDGSDGGSSEDNEDGNPAHPAGDGAPKGPMRRKPLSTPTITQDAIAHRLAKEHQVDVVLSTGALVALVLLRSSQAEEVAIPFKIVGEIGDDGGIRKTLVVDKPLPTILSLTPRRRNRLYYDAMLEAMLVDTTKPKTLGGAGVERDLAGLVDTASANLNYTLWQLGDMRIMIRYKVHGYVNEPVDGHLPAQDTRAKNAGDQGKRQSNVVSRTLTIKSKLEYQYDYAPEEISEAERIRWWLSCYVRGTAQMLIGHIDVGTNELVRLERQSLKDILPPAWASLPDACTRYLSFVLARLQEFEPGEYVLTHRKNDVDMRVLASLPTEASAPSTRSLRASTAVQSSYDLWHWLGWPLAKNGDAPSPYVDQPLPTMADESEYVPARWVGAPDKIPYTFPAEPPWYHRSESADDAPEGGYSGEFGGRRSRRKTNKKKKQQRKRRRQQQQQQQQQQGTNIQSENAGTSKRLKVG
ncbi:hypothetical protein EV182_003500 [Spiromyces aspiralis]|uniref:Uncharacterized protein n=1 Tax=Spiromyces aspiralis TaxID=68401 RepID=A0ACC1HCL4_9FUNG|nr:hypothetical protein EV182_003500 [Spiromyces aspiralis]